MYKANLRLNNQVSIPKIGLGTWQLTGEICVKAVTTALEVGYRHIDTADLYQNHQEIAKAIKQSRVRRQDVFITTKLKPYDLKKYRVKGAAERFLKELNTDYIDLLLIHWPNPGIPINETLESMHGLKQKGVIKSIGVSNFNITMLKEAQSSGFEINNNQIEFHPSLNQKNLKTYCDQSNIIVTSYSPLAQKEDLSLGLIQDLSLKYERSKSQIILNWIFSKGMIAIPRSSNANHIKDNIKALEWQMDPNDLERIDLIDRGNRLVNPTFYLFNGS